MPAIEIQHIRKTYPSKPAPVIALDDISISVPDGELFGVIGPDGAGKTSLFRILTTLLLADSGSALVMGLDVVKNYREIRRRVGYMPGRFSLYQDLSVEENLGFFASIFHTTIKENYHLIKDIYSHIEPFKKRKAGQLSGGMKQKLALSCALIHRPEVLFLDEPTTGVDALSRVEFWDMLRNLKKQGITIMVSTPYMDEAALCDKVALMNKGALLALDTPSGIRDAFGELLWAIKSADMYRLLLDLREFPGIGTAFPFGEYYHITLSDKRKFADISAYLSERHHEAIEIHPVEAGIEDVFMKKMK
jgi:ABC-type multidrug transport system ATPase subunit